ncbi:MAG: stage V sporulation protein AC [Ruminococcaceae bacterium]|nr:stage V sporulation protein AC [Oscillospiraceae bacterium]
MAKKNYSEKEKEAFRKYADSHAPKRNMLKDCTVAFLVGGTICLAGQGLFDLYSKLQVTEDTAKSLVSVTLILLSCILTGLGLYSRIAKYAGAGTLVPITGFANAVCSPAIDSRAEGYILGVASKMFVIAGPVIVYGTVASVIYGVVYYLMKIL